MRRRQIWKQTGIALTLALLLTGCSGTQKETADPVQPEPAEAELSAEAEEAPEV